MIDKFRKFMDPKNKANRRSKVRMVLIYVIFGAIILVFALFGVDNSRYGEATGGVAAVVNTTPISLAEYDIRVENMERQMRANLEQFPEAQRRRFSAQMRSRALEELILGEVIYQAADEKGLMASDPEVRDYIVQIPFLTDNGKFQRERYDAFLQSQRLHSADFERQVRKQLVTQKLQELFVGSASPSREELRRQRLLASQKVNIRFAQLRPEQLGNPAFISDAEAQAYLAANKPAVEKYYNENKVEFSKPEMVKARHILLRANDKRDEAATAKLADEIAKQANPGNFAELAKKHSEDPGSKVNGGDLGSFERGRMVPAFEDAAFGMKAGEITKKPVKSDFGYHIIFVEGKTPAKTESLEEAQVAIARKLVARGKEAEVTAALRKAAEGGNKKEIDGMLAKAGVKWDESGEFDLASPAIPKLGDSPAVMGAILKRGKSGGLVPQLISTGDGYVLVDVISYKESAPVAMTEGMERQEAFRKSSDLIETWSKEVEARADIQRNPRLIQSIQQ